MFARRAEKGHGDLGIEISNCGFGMWLEFYYTALREGSAGIHKGKSSPTGCSVACVWGSVSERAVVFQGEAEQDVRHRQLARLALQV